LVEATRRSTRQGARTKPSELLGVVRAPLPAFFG